jgi:ParB family transcriptional regulator, chromosome partitioning protein
MAKNQVLGRGLNALIRDYPENAEGDTREQIVHLNVNEIEVNPYQARTEFADDHIEELMNSIKEKGIINPIVVNRVGQGFQIIAGERRWRATKRANIDTIPCIIKEIESSEEVMELSLIENVQREDLNPIEEAEGYHALMDRCFLTQDQVAQRVGKQRSTIANICRLLGLPQDIQDLLRGGQLSMGHARALLGLDDTDAQIELGQRAIAEKMNVRELERAVNVRKSGRNSRKKAPAPERRDPQLDLFEERLQHRFGTSVRIQNNVDKGRIEIAYYDKADLERVLELLLDEEE